MKFKKWLVILLILFLNGCLSQIAPVNESAQTWIGRPIIDRQNMMYRSGDYPSRIGWQEKTYKLDSGKWVYVEPVRPDCFIHWEVNQEGIIIGYRTEGKRCY